MKSQRTDRDNSRPMTPDERRRFEENVIHGGDEPAADDSLGDRTSRDDHLTESGRLDSTDGEQTQKKSRR